MKFTIAENNQCNSYIYVRRLAINVWRTGDRVELEFEDGSILLWEDGQFWL